MPRRPCAQLAAWGTAWLQGAASFDDVLDAVADRYREVAGPGFGPLEVHPVGAAITEWRRQGARRIRLALPIPGDVRGLVGESDFRSAALCAGEAAFADGHGITAVPAPLTRSSAAPERVWHYCASGEPPPDPLSVPDAEHDLTEAIRLTASEFAGRHAPSWLTGIAASLSDARRAGEKLHLPASHPPRGVRLVAQAERLAAVLNLIDQDSTGELTAAGMAERAELLAPLRVAVRRALLAGYNSAAEVTAE